MNYEFNLLHHVGAVAKRLHAAAAVETAHEGDDNTPSGLRVKKYLFFKPKNHKLTTQAVTVQVITSQSMTRRSRARGSA